MNRRTALKAIGMVVAGFTGQAVAADDTLFPKDLWTQPQTLEFAEAGYKSLILVRKNGKRITIPMGDIFDALEKG